MNTKTCTVCKEVKSVSEFTIDRKSRDGLRGSCRTCNMARCVEYRQNTKYHDTPRERERGWCRRGINLRFDDFVNMLERQGYQCAICKTPVYLQRGQHTHVDHDHITGIVRAVLCNHCNIGLGSFKDNTNLMITAAQYIKRHKQA